MRGFRSPALAFLLTLAPAGAMADFQAGSAAWQAGDLGEARRQWQAAASDGVVDAKVALARLLIHGEGGSRDVPAAAGWLDRAATEGSAEGAFELARLLEFGRDVPTDRARALSLYETAAEAGHPGAIARLSASRPVIATDDERPSAAPPPATVAALPDPAPPAEPEVATDPPEPPVEVSEAPEPPAEVSEAPAPLVEVGAAVAPVDAPAAEQPPVEMAAAETQPVPPPRPPAPVRAAVARETEPTDTQATTAGLGPPPAPLPQSTPPGVTVFTPSAPTASAAEPNGDLVSSGNSPVLAHIASYRLRDRADGGWPLLTEGFAEAGRMSPIIRTLAVAGRGTFHRLYADGPEPTLRAFCDWLQARDLFCQMTDRDGRRLDG